MIMASGLQSIGLPEIQIKAINRTGSTLSIGGVYALDVAQTATESTTPEAGAQHVVATASTNLKRVLVVAMGATLDDAEGLFTLCSNDVQILTDGGTVDVAKGDPLIPQAASPNLLVQGASSLVTAVAFAHEGQTSATGTLTRCAFDGRFKPAMTPAS